MADSNLTPNPFPWWEGEPEGAAALPARTVRLLALGAIAIYRAAVSPVIHAINGPACRFEPSCSEYARDAIAEYGIIRGGIMAIWRVARCNPIGGHGYDPVAPRSMPANLTPNPFPSGKGNQSRRVGF